MKTRTIALAAVCGFSLACGFGGGGKKQKGKKKRSPKAPMGEETEGAQIAPLIHVKLDGPAKKKMVELGEEISVTVSVWDLPIDPKVHGELSYDLGSEGGQIYMESLFIDADEAGNKPVEFQIQVISARKKVKTNLLHCSPKGYPVDEVPDEVHVNCILI